MNIKLFRYGLLIILFFIYINGQCQTTDLDSLIEKVKKASDPLQLFSAQRNLGLYYSDIGNIEGYELICQQLLKSAKILNNDSLLMIAYGDLANYFSNKSESESSLEYNLKALLIAEKLNDVDRVCKLYNNIGDEYRNLKNYPKSLEYLRKAQELLAKASIKTPVLPQYVYINFCEVYLGLNNTDSALRYVQLANEEFSKNRNDLEYVNALYDFALVYEKKGDFDLSESYYKKSIAFADSVTDLYNLTTAAKNYALFLFKLKRYQDVIKYAVKSIESANQSGNKLGVINAASLLHESFLKLGKKDSGYKYLAIKDTYRDSVFNEEHLNKIQEITFNEQLREKEKEAQLAQENLTRKVNIQYAAIAATILLSIIIFLILSHSFVVNTRHIKFLGLILLLIVFEFIIILIHPYISKFTDHSPVIILLINVIIAGILISPHHYLENMINHRLVEKNKKIRLKAAHKIIASLSENKKDGK